MQRRSRVLAGIPAISLTAAACSGSDDPVGTDAEEPMEAPGNEESIEDDVGSGGDPQAEYSGPEADLSNSYGEPEPADLTIGFLQPLRANDGSIRPGPMDRSTRRKC